MASVHFHAVLDKPALMENTFDARVFSLSDPVEVANYFIWRQRDAVRNSIQMAGQSKYSQSELKNVSTKQIQEKLFQDHQINWNDYPDGFKRGRVCWKVRYDLDVPEYGTTERYRWTTVPAPHFVAEPGTFLAALIPPMPTLPAIKES
jgi:tRNA(His) 5'-end guanylyltransferase